MVSIPLPNNYFSIVILNAFSIRQIPIINMMMDWLLNRDKLLADKKKLGKWGEKCCEGFLKKKGFKKLARNYSCKTGEIDLVMADTDGAVVFVEVKTRADEKLTSAESAVTAAKKTRMNRAARYFLATNNIKDRPLRFDVVAIVLGPKGRPQIRHYENAFVP
ncbi:MAG: YraN family protein [Phycisphaerae bacterium]